MCNVCGSWLLWVAAVDALAQAEQARRTKRARKGLCLVLQLGSTLQGRGQRAAHVSVVGVCAGRLQCVHARRSRFS